MNYNMKKITLTVAPNVPVLEFIELVLSALHPKFAGVGICILVEAVKTM